MYNSFVFVGGYNWWFKHTTPINVLKDLVFHEKDKPNPRFCLNGSLIAKNNGVAPMVHDLSGFHKKCLNFQDCNYAILPQIIM